MTERQDSSCPRPEKRVYLTRAEAKKAIHNWSRREKSSKLRAYKCVCGQWHVGRLSKQIVKGVKDRSVLDD